MVMATIVFKVGSKCWRGMVVFALSEAVTDVTIVLSSQVANKPRSLFFLKEQQPRHCFCHQHLQTALFLSIQATMACMQ